MVAARMTDPLARLRNPRLEGAPIEGLRFRPIPLHPSYWPLCELPGIVGFRQLKGGNTAAL